MVKVCVYAICKNEIKNLDEWYNRVKDADIVYVLDTGSTDGTFEEMSMYPNLMHSEYVYDGDFDFSEARNEALYRARLRDISVADQWVYVSLDLDEFLEEGGIQKIRDAWSSEYDTLRLTGVTIGEGAQYVDHKVHSEGPWIWKRRVHEIISLPDKRQKDWVIGTDVSITYEHRQDKSKVRNYYQQLQKAYEDDPRDIKTVIYLAWESFNAGLYDDYLKYSKECADLVLNNTEDEFYLDYEYLLQCYFNCANYHMIHRQFAVADMYLNRCKTIVDLGHFPPFRKLYYLKAQVQWELEQKEIAINYYKKCLGIKDRPYCWVDDDQYYDDGLIYMMISNGYFYFSRPKEALAYAELAHAVHPEDESMQNNLAYIREYFANYTPQIEKQNKICIYAICKNEIQFVDKWLDSMSEADYVVVLDTGSTDGTYEKLKADPRVYRVEQKVITPWRFDTARNEGMKLIPDDANILLSTDLDEWLEPGWADIIRSNWIDGYHVRGTYKYAWSHTEDGQPGRVFYYDKLHDKNWYWTAPVHELLTSDIYDEEYRYSHSLDLFEAGVYLHHYPDPTKSRGSYLPLLELRAEENPEDYYGKYYLSHEYNYREMYDKSNAVLEDILANYRDKYSNVEVAACYLFLGDNYLSLGDQEKAIYYYNMSIRQEPSYREPYLLAAEIFNDKKNYRLAIAYVEEALEKSYRHFTWVERDESWREKVDDILAVSYSYLGEHEKALEHAKRAVELNPHDTRLRYNLEVVSQAV